MAFFDQLFTNIFWDGEVTGVSPDSTTDYYLITDYQIDYKYLHGRIADIIRAISQDPTKEFFILFGGEVTDGGSGTINISEGAFVGKDNDGKRTVFHIPALTGVTVPTAYKDDRQIWVKSYYDFKLGTLTRTHRSGELYHYQILDTYYGDSNGYYSTSASDLFTDSDPGDTLIILGSFQMSSGNVYTEVKEEQTRSFFCDEFSYSSTVTSATSMTTNSRYYINGTSRLNMTLPSISSVGDILELFDISGQGFKIMQGSGQNILYKHKSTIPGTAGYLSSRISYASYRLICTVANTTWECLEINDLLTINGYMMGGLGDDGNCKSDICNANFNNETFNYIGATLSSPKKTGAGVSGQLKGYFMGGQISGSPVNVIEDMNFTDETSAVITATLDTGRASQVGLFSSLKGYCCGGYSGITLLTSVEDMNFTDETSAVITATLDAAKYYGAGVSGQLKGYFMGGWTTSPTFLNVIEDMNFTDETSAVITATLDTGRASQVGLFSSLKGYCCGGYSGTTLLTSVEDMNFTDETSSVIGAILASSVATINIAGVSGENFGYMMGGMSLSTVYGVVEQFNFKTEMINSVYGGLSMPTSGGCGVQGYIA